MFRFCEPLALFQQRGGKVIVRPAIRALAEGGFHRRIVFAPMVELPQLAVAAGSRILSRCSTRCSHTFWPTFSASASPSRCLRQIDQISGMYRSTSASQACLSPLRRESPAR